MGTYHVSGSLLASIRFFNMEKRHSTIVQVRFEDSKPVSGPCNGFLVRRFKKARYPVASQAEIQFSDEILVLTTVTEEDTIGRIRHRRMLPQASQEFETAPNEFG